MIMKRNSNFFDVYIIKLLKNISENAEICRDTRNQINIIIQIFCQKIVDIVYLLLKNTKKKTITLNTVSHGIEIFLLGDLQKNAKKISQYVIDNKFTLILPNHLSEKFLRKFGNSNYSVSKKGIIYLTATLEYLLGEILDLSFTYTKYKKRTRITVSDLELSLREDVEFQPILQKYNIIFINGNKTNNNITYNRRKKVKKNGKLCYLPGEKSIQTIYHLQKKNKLIFPLESFRNLIKENLYQKISNLFFQYFQSYIESFLEDIFQKSQIISLHSNKNKVSSSDIETCCKICNINISNDIIISNNNITDKNSDVFVNFNLEDDFNIPIKLIKLT